MMSVNKEEENDNRGRRNPGFFAHIDIKDDIRQSMVIAKNEIKKFFSGKKIYIFSAIILLMIVLMSVVPYLLADGYDTAADLTVMFLMFISFFIMLAGVLFTATSLVSEFEERTALILFTRPIRKWSIYLGKFLASFAVITAYVAIYYVYIAVFSIATQGEIAGNLVLSFGLALCGIFGVCAVSMVLSAIAKKGSTASIMTLVVLMLVLSMIASLISTYGYDSWWILSDALGDIADSVGTMTVDENTHEMILETASTHVARSAGVMIGWGIIANIVAFLLFRKRDF